MKFEYMVIEIDGYRQVTLVNGEETAKLVKKGGVFSGSDQYTSQPILHEFLNAAGKDGWKVSCSAFGGVYLILERPLP